MMRSADGSSSLAADHVRAMVLVISVDEDVVVVAR
jgi:hypothetical protein